MAVYPVQEMLLDILAHWLIGDTVVRYSPLRASVGVVV